MVSQADVAYLFEFSDTFKGLSKVKQLAIAPNFPWKPEDKRSHCGTPAESRKEWTFGNKKSDTVYHFLKVTNQLESLELGAMRGCTPQRGDSTEINPTCIDALTSSFKTLKHLRVIQGTPQFENRLFANLTPFESLTILGIDQVPITALSAWKQSPLPPKLEILQLLHYLFTPDQSVDGDFSEERELRTILENRECPTLKEVVVPAAPVDFADQTTEHIESFKQWRAIREKLSSLEGFKN